MLYAFADFFTLADFAVKGPYQPLSPPTASWLHRRWPSGRPLNLRSRRRGPAAGVGPAFGAALSSDVRAARFRPEPTSRPRRFIGPCRASIAPVKRSRSAINNATICSTCINRIVTFLSRRFDEKLNIAYGYGGSLPLTGRILFWRGTPSVGSMRNRSGAAKICRSLDSCARSHYYSSIPH